MAGGGRWPVGRAGRGAVTGEAAAAAASGLERGPHPGERWYSTASEQTQEPAGQLAMAMVGASGSHSAAYSRWRSGRRWCSSTRGCAWAPHPPRHCHSTAPGTPGMDPPTAPAQRETPRPGPGPAPPRPFCSRSPVFPDPLSVHHPAKMDSHPRCCSIVLRPPFHLPPRSGGRPASGWPRYSVCVPELSSTGGAFSCLSACQTSHSWTPQLCRCHATHASASGEACRSSAVRGACLHECQCGSAPRAKACGHTSAGQHDRGCPRQAGVGRGADPQLGVG